MFTTDAYWCKNQKRPDKPYEDRYWHGRDTRRQAVLIVADGVTRSVLPGERYPSPSLAEFAAEAVVRSLSQTLPRVELSETALRQAWVQANAAVGAVAQQRRVTEYTDFYLNDYPGAVAAAAIVTAKPQEFWWMYLTDCGVAHLMNSGELWLTPDRLTPLRAEFPKNLPEKDTRIAIRRDYRNKPGRGFDHSFGVLTGELPALEYLEMGKRTYQKNDVIAVFSDGCRAFFADPRFLTLLYEGKKTEIQAHVASSPRDIEHDDKTIIVTRIY